MLTSAERLACPSCGETIEIVVDLSVAEQRYVEDCCVCCRPLSVHCICDGSEVLELNVTAESA